jgi:hypothetical protein
MLFGPELEYVTYLRSGTGADRQELCEDRRKQTLHGFRSS